MTNKPIVNISDAKRGTDVIPTKALKPGMGVFDIFGTEYTLTKVTHFKHGCRSTRSDGCKEWWPYGITVTVRK